MGRMKQKRGGTDGALLAAGAMKFTWFSNK
jgi:hypothetical protein